MKTQKIPRLNSLVKFNYSSFTEPHMQEVKKQYKKIFDNSVFLFLGPIPNKPGYCAILCCKTGEVFTGYHASNFVELAEDKT